MNKQYLFTFFLSVLFLSSQAQVNLQYSGVKFSKDFSAQHSQPYFVFFTEKNCKACEAMIMHTFSDEQVVADVHGKIGAYKVDVNAASSQEWVKKYDVNTLPSVLFFDKDANLIQRVEEPMTAVIFQSVLKKPEAYHKLRGQFAEAQEVIGTEDDASTIIAMEQNKNSKLTEPSVPMQTSNAMEWKDDDTEAVASDYSAVPVNERPTFKAEPVLEMNESGNYQVQMGFFETFRYAERMSHDLKNSYNYPVVMESDFSRGKEMYRVVLTGFEGLADAKNAYRKMKSAGRKAFVKAKE